MQRVVPWSLAAVLVLGLTVACGSAPCDDTLPSVTAKLCPGLPDEWRLDVEQDGTWDGNVTLTDNPPGAAVRKPRTSREVWTWSR